MLRVSGPLRAIDDEGCEVRLRPMERRLVAALVVTRPHPVTTDVLADALWPGGAPRTAHKTIQTNVLRVRSALGPHVVETIGDGYRLGSDVRVDVDALGFVDGDPGATAVDVERLPLDGRGGGTEPLPEVAGWERAAPMRAWIVELLRDHERHHLVALVQRGEPSAVAACEAFVAASPLDEAAWCVLIQALIEAGRAPEALRAWERARRILVEELETSPGPELDDLHHRLLRDQTSRGEELGWGTRLSRAEAALERAGVGWQTGLDATDPVVVELERALEEVPAGPSPLRARLLARWAVACSHHRSGAECRDAARRAAATAAQLGSPAVLAEAAHALAVVLDDPAEDHERRRWAEVLESLALAHDRAEWASWAVPVLARSDGLAGDIDAAATRLELTDAAEAALLRASVAGDWRACRLAAAEHRRSQEGRLFDPFAATLQEAGILAVVSLHEGTAKPVDVGYMEWPLASMSLSVAAWSAAVLARSGDQSGAVRVLDALDTDDVGSLARDGYFLSLHAMLADAAHLSCHQGIAALVVERLEPFIGSTTFDPGMVYRGATSHAAGVAHAALGHRDVAVDLLRDAVGIHRGHGSPWMLQRSADALSGLGAKVAP